MATGAEDFHCDWFFFWKVRGADRLWQMPGCPSKFHTNKYINNQIIGAWGWGDLYDHDDAKEICLSIFLQTVHKKTFYYLEQLILKHKLHQNALNIKEIHGRSMAHDFMFHFSMYHNIHIFKGGTCYIPQGF